LIFFRDNVIGLLKKKTAWYVVARALREKAAAAANEFRFDLKETFNKGTLAHNVYSLN
jgi:hypothetical protein